MAVFDRLRRRQPAEESRRPQGPIWGDGTANPEMDPRGVMQRGPGSRPESGQAGFNPDGVTSSAAVDASVAEARRKGEQMGAEQLARMSGHEPFRAAVPAQQVLGNQMTKERLIQAQKTLVRYKAGKASVDRRIQNAQDWWKLRNWQRIESERGTKGAQRVKSNTAWLWNCVVGKHADAMDSFPEPVILPREKGDKQEAERLSKILPVVLKMNGFEETYSMEQWQKLTEGTGGYGVFWDKNKMNGMGDIAIRKVNLLNLVWEPGIDDIQESRNVFYVVKVDNEVLDETYPQLKGKDKKAGFSMAEYRTDDHAQDENKSLVIDWYYKTWNGPRKVLHFCKFVGLEVLFCTEGTPGYENGLYDDGDYPFVLDAMYPVEGSPAGYGMIDIGKDAQTDIDTLNQAMVLNAVNSATPRYFSRKDGGVNEQEFTDLSKPLVHVNGMLGDDTLKPVTTPRLGGDTFNMLQAKIDELKFVTGNTDVNNGGVPAGVTAASAIAALKEDSGRSSKDSNRGSYRAACQLYNLCIERIRQFYDMPRQFRIIGSDGQEDYIEFDNSGMQPQVIPGGMGQEDTLRLPVFDVDIRAQRENAYTRLSQNELAVQFYQMGLFNPQNTDQSLMVLGMMDFKGKDEIEQKIRQNGTLIDTLMKVGQIAMQLAAQTRPEIAAQLAQVLQGVGADMGRLMSAGTAGKIPGQTGSPDDAMSGAHDNENGIVRNMRERVANASRPG